MISFNVVKSRLRILGIIDIRSSELPIHRIMNIAYRIFVLTLFILVMVSSAWFMIFEAQNFEDFARIVPNIAAGTIGMASHVSLLYDKSKTVQLIDELNKLIESRVENRSIYEEANKKFEKRSKIITSLQSFILIPGYLLPNVLTSYYQYFTTEKSNAAFRLVIPATLPYDWRPTFPYLGTYFIQSLAIFFCCLAFFVALFLPIGLCWYSIVFISDLELSLFKLNSEIGRASGKLKKSNLIASKQKLCEIIRFRCEAEQFVNKFSVTFKCFNSISLLMLSLLVPCYLILLEASITAADLASLNLSLDGFIFFNVWLFLLCFFGNEVTNRFISFSDSIYDVEWYCYPPEIRNHFQIIILASQRPIYVQGYLNFNCSFDIFKKIMNKSYSAFMLFRKFNN